MFHIYESHLVTKFLLLLLPSHVPRFTYVVVFLTCRSSSCSWQFSFWFHLHNLLWDSVFIDLYLWVCRILPCHLYTLHITHMNMYTIYTHICTCTNKQTNKQIKREILRSTLRAAHQIIHQHIGGVRSCQRWVTDYYIRDLLCQNAWPVISIIRDNIAAGI